MFKRSLTYVDSDDTGLGDKVVDFGRQYEFGDVSWFPGHKKAVYRVDFRVPTNASGNGLNDFIGFRSTTALALALSRLIGTFSSSFFFFNIKNRFLSISFVNLVAF